MREYFEQRIYTTKNATAEAGTEDDGAYAEDKDPDESFEDPDTIEFFDT